MYSQELLETLFDRETLQYLARKNIGGSSNEKGNTYENFFAIYQLAQLAREAIETGKTFNFSSQVQAFVDDLIIACNDETLLSHFQLKNSTSVNWGDGLRSLADDFEKQHHLNQAVSKTSDLNLVVSDLQLCQRLSSTIPTSISSYSQVQYFPFDPNFSRVIKEPKFRSALIYLTAFDDPDEDKIECVATVLLGAWASSDRINISLITLLEKAQQCQPSYIRSLIGTEICLDAEVVTILSSIPNFTYTLSKGFLHWSFQGGLDQGTLRYSCETEDFQRFQELIKQHFPTSFEELEIFLL